MMNTTIVTHHDLLDPCSWVMLLFHASETSTNRFKATSRTLFVLMYLLFERKVFGRIVLSFAPITQQSRPGRLRMSAMPVGRLIARILPQNIVEQHATRQPKHQIDAKSLIEQLVQRHSEIPPSVPAPKLHADSFKDSIILLQASISEGDTIKQVNLQRAWNEPAINTFKRLSLSLCPAAPARIIGKKDRVIGRKKEPPGRKAKVFLGDEQLDFTDMLSSEVWAHLAGQEGARIELPVALTASDVMHLEIIACAPMILSTNTFENFEANIYCGVPVVVQAQVYHCDKAMISWFVNGDLRAENADSYTPTNEDIEKTISVLINPGGFVEFAEAYQFQRCVKALPEMPFVHTFRKKWTAPRTEDDIRVMSYNVLADQYTSKSGPKPDKMAYCSREVLQRGRRMPLLMHEILSYRADIVSLQEVDSKLYHSFYYPVLASQGYQGFFTNKITGSQEGCAVFWSTDVFQVTDEQEDQKAFSIRHLLTEDELTSDDPAWKESFRQVKSLYTSLPRVEALANDLGQILQVVRLTFQRDNRRQLVVGNTHLYYHPYGDHIRAIQVLGICHKLGDFARACPLILTGDFNSDPEAGAMGLLLHRTLNPAHPDAWKNLMLHPPQKKDAKRGSSVPETALHPPTLRLPESFPTLISAYKYSDATEFTHHVDGYIGVLDYILLSDDDFDVVKRARLPTTLYMPDPLPTKEQSSDHISLVCDLKWKDQSLL
jgi:mRNA deadenylase 3'-5' endonuclease subunit Ccr4